MPSIYLLRYLRLLHVALIVIIACTVFIFHFLPVLSPLKGLVDTMKYLKNLSKSPCVVLAHIRTHYINNLNLRFLQL